MLYPSDVDELREPKWEAPRREPVAGWKFGLVLAAFPVFFNVAVGVGGWWSVGLWLAFMVGLCLAAVRWGAESRDGRDWKPAFQLFPDRHARRA
jgi:hypothetical protein